jgi:hypothetical protein
MHGACMDWNFFFFFLDISEGKLVEAWTLLHEDELNAAASFVGAGCMERER